MPANSCTVEEYANSDDDSSIGINMNHDMWQRTFIEQLSEQSEEPEEIGRRRMAMN